jgi:hypothetical protein
MFTRGADGKYYIEVPRTSADIIEYKVTRGDWRTVECAWSGRDIDNRTYFGYAGDEVRIKVEGWKDLQ